MQVEGLDAIWFRLRATWFCRGSAVGPVPDEHERDWRLELARPGPVEHWPDFVWTLQADAHAPLPLDLISAPFGGLLLSSRFKALIDELGPWPGLEWMPATIQCDADPDQLYWAPSLLRQPTVFVEETVRLHIDGGILLAGLDAHRADNHRFLAIHRGADTLDLHGHTELRTAAEAVGLNGLWWLTSELSWPPDQIEAAFPGSTTSMLLPGGPAFDALPAELQTAIEEGHQLYGDEPHASAGPVILRPAQLVVGRLVPVERGEPGDTIGVRVVDFTHARAWAGSAADLLVWLPDHHMFATYDGDHGHLYTFPGVCWNDIAAQPGRYLNAMWEDPTYYADAPPPVTALFEA